MFIVGAENTGKTSLIFSFLGEKFIEDQAATKGVDVEVCKIYCKDWIKISHSDKSNILHNQFSNQCKDNVLKTLVDSSIPSSPKPSTFKLCTKSSITHSDVLFTTVPIKESMMSLSHSGAGGNSVKPHPREVSVKAAQYSSDSQIASIWDFAGQTIFHNSHSVFISDNGVTMIIFNASKALTDNIVPREDSSYPSECCTVISSIHYWLQVVNSVCTVKENVLLVGTHIDKFHPIVKEAREIASTNILPVLEKMSFLESLMLSI